MHQLFYATLDPEKALGIEDLIPSYHILHSENSQLAVPIADHGIDIRNFPKDPNLKSFSTGKFLESESVQKYIKDNAHSNPNILVFKNDSKIEEICKKQGYNLLNPSQALAKRLENKVEFSKFLDSIELFDQPKYTTFEKLSDLKYDDISKEYGIEFVIQFFFGHSGNCTFFIKSDVQLHLLQDKYPLRKGKIVKKINGIPYTVNACITRLGVVIGGISEQITGVSALTSSEGGTVGNDFSQRHLSEYLRSDLIMKATQFGEILMKEGHRGIFGLDFVLDLEANTFFLIEANIRQTASCSFTSYLERDQKQVPIMLWHAMELLNHNYYENFTVLDEEHESWINDQIGKFRLSNDKLSFNIEMNQPVQASQVFFRNIKDHSVKLLDQFPSGIYRIRGRMPDETAAMEHEDPYPAIFRLREDGWSTLCLMERGYNILQAKAAGGFLINTVPSETVVPELGEIGRIQVMESAFGSAADTNISGWFTDVVNAVYENTRLIDIVKE